MTELRTATDEPGLAVRVSSQLEQQGYIDRVSVHQIERLIHKGDNLASFRLVMRDYKSALSLAADSLAYPVHPIASEAQQPVLTATTMLLKASDRKSDDTPEQERQRIENEQIVFQWFNRQNPGIVNLIRSHLPADKLPELEPELRRLIVDGVIHWSAAERSLASAYRWPVVDEHNKPLFRTSRLEQKQLKGLAEFLIKNSANFASLADEFSLEGVGESIHSPEDQSRVVERILDFALIENQAETSIFELDENTKLNLLREWVRRTAVEARQGRKIFLTPFYKDIVERLDFVSRKRNGIGGIILYGPPGTGKTELLIEKNRRQGFETRVVNIHYYSTFAELIAEKSVSLRGEPGADKARKLGDIVAMIADDSPEEFSKYVKTLLTRLQSEGKVDKRMNMHSFLTDVFLNLPQTDQTSEIRNALDKANLSVEDWLKIKEYYVANIKSQALQTTLGTKYQDIIKDVVLGEILQSLKESETEGKKVRVVLDEIEKGGPNAFGGILTLLAKSPGDTYRYGEGPPITLPAWFKVDATCNGTVLREDLKSRFHHEKVDMPPAKDQLMIAAARLTDREGNLYLSNYEQDQLVGLFVYLLPAVNQDLARYNLPPVSNRDILRFAGDIWDMQREERTNISVEEAIHNMLLKDKIWPTQGANGKPIYIREQIENHLKRFARMIGNQPRDFRQEKRALRITNPLLMKRNPQVAKERATAQQVLSESQERSYTDQAPLLVAIAGLISQQETSKLPQLHKVSLRKGQREIVARSLDEQKTVADTSSNNQTLVLPTGLIINGITSDSGLTVRIETSREGELNNHVFLRETLRMPEARMKGASVDGKVLAVLSPTDNGDRLSVLVFKNKEYGAGYEEVSLMKENSEGNDVDQETVIPKAAEIEVSKDGSKIAVWNKERKTVQLFSVSTDRLSTHEYTNVENYCINEDGTLIAISTAGQGVPATYVYNTPQAASPTQLRNTLPGNQWKFASNKLLVQIPLDKEAVNQDAYLVAA